MDVTLVFVGDVMLGRATNAVLTVMPPAYPWGDVLRVFAQAQWRACNLECAISDRGAPWIATPKALHFRSDAKNVAVLSAAGIDAVSLANNHALDYSEEALLDTLDILDAATIVHGGAGRDYAQATAPAVKTVGGGSIGLIAFTDSQPEWQAGGDDPGVFYVPIDPNDARAASLFEAVGRAKASVNLLVVSAHWGPNWGYRPPVGHVDFAHRLIDAGADVVFGHSAHVVRGVEFYRSRPIIYCAGDFIDDYAVNVWERNDESGIFLVEFEANAAAGLRFYPTVIADCQASLALGRRARRIAERFVDLCRSCGTSARWDEQAGVVEIEISPPRREIP